MRKQQKIIELRTAAKCKVAELETKIAFARSEAAENRSGVMRERAAELNGLKAGSTERFDVLAKYRAELADVEWTLADTVASLKYEIQQAKAECERQCAAVEEDHETAKEQAQPETVYCDGSEHSARIVALRIINKIPHIPEGAFLHVHIVEDGFSDNQDYFVSVWYGLGHQTVNTIFAPRLHTAEFEAAFVEKCRRLFADEPESGNSHVAEPLSRALDAVFGGNPVEQVDNLIADTVNNGKEGSNE